jgi:tetratricopeptide (TPR) repeat protein
MSLPDSQKRLHPVVSGAVIFLLVLVAYIPAYHAGFIWDDDMYVTNNPLLHEPGGLWKIWFSAHFQSQYFPLVYTTLRAEYALWGLNPVGYHVVNVVLHGMNALLVWAILRRLDAPGAWLAAAIFAVHPVEVESVAWVTELKNTESTLFYLLAVLAWMKFIGSDLTSSRPARSSRGEGDGTHLAGTAKIHNASPWWFYAAALMCQALALFSKTTACTLPAALVLTLWLRKERFNARRVFQIAPFVLMGLGMGMVSIWWEGHLGNYAQELGLSFSLLERTLIACHALWFYAAKLAWPANLAFSYARWQINANDLAQYFWPVACVAVAVLLWFKREKWPRMAIAAVVFFVAALSPLLGFISEYTFRFSFVADHYQYTASVGLIALFAGMLSTGMAKWQAPREAQVLVVAALLMVLTLLTWRQAGVYGNLETLWRDTLKKNPESWMAHYNLGLCLAERGKGGEAIEEFQSAIKYNPRHAKARVNLGLELEKAGRTEEAISAYEGALQIEPNFPLAQYDLGTMLAEHGKYEEAVDHLRKAVQFNPKQVKAWDNLVLALAKDSKTNEALDSLKQEVAANPDNLPAMYNLAQGLASKGRLDEATEVYKQALKLSPSNASILNNLGNTLFSAGRKDEGIGYLKKAIEVDPKNPSVCFNLAMMLAQKGDFEEAKKQLTEALRLKPDFVQAQQQLKALEAKSGPPVPSK